eukprot:CAMPEP_0115873728 /NCGR_PEP_ID=MMETSP0287-20121206/24150_1 /TAXON_ID=412157 /ORGANISM="Chrysochromulina rotalis, Strain UIO044" /LENGTH=88 /DNA_ID=CAMNT_0003328807 /DNA_START=482 /DNA_END=748 /DNA_ORIENTATION=-
MNTSCFECKHESSRQALYKLEGHQSPPSRVRVSKLPCHHVQVPVAPWDGDSFLIRYGGEQVVCIMVVRAEYRGDLNVMVHRHILLQHP